MPMPKKDSQTRPGGMVSPERRNVTRSAAEATATRSQTKVRAGSLGAPIPLKKKLLPTNRKDKKEDPFRAAHDGDVIAGGSWHGGRLPRRDDQSNGSRIGRAHSGLCRHLARRREGTYADGAKTREDEACAGRGSIRRVIQHSRLWRATRCCQVRGSPFGSWERTGTRVPLAGARLLPPVMPPTFYACGMNYAEHVKEVAAKVGQPPNLPAQPDIGYRAANALIGPGEPIVIAADATRRCNTRASSLR